MLLPIPFKRIFWIWQDNSMHFFRFSKLLKNNAVANTIQEDILDLARQQHAFFQIFNWRFQ
jgi:hypothetical protein